MEIRYSVSSVILLSMQAIFPKRAGESIAYRSVLPVELDANVGGNEVQMRRYEGSQEFPRGSDPRRLTVYVTASSASEAAEMALDATEWVVDFVAFSFATHIPTTTQHIEVVGGCDASVGEAIDIPKFRRTVVHCEVTWQSPFSLVDRPETFSENRRAALRWYHKGMETPYDVDRFIFFWISLEILAKSDEPELVPVPFRHSCGARDS